MRVKVFVCIVFLFLFHATGKANTLSDTLKKNMSFPSQVGWVNDFEQVFDSSETKTLINLAMHHQEKTSDQICIVTIARPWEDLADYARDLANFWGIGVKGKNNGVVIVLSKAKHEVRIATGYGIEKRVTDSMCKKIIDGKMIPKFRDNDYGSGMIDGVKEIISALEKTDSSR